MHPVGYSAREKIARWGGGGQRQTAVTAYLKSKQLLQFVFARFDCFDHAILTEPYSFVDLF